MEPAALLRRAYRAGRRWLIARELARCPAYRFTDDYVAGNTERWSELLAAYRDRPGVRFLEIGSFEGRSALWFLEHVLTGPGSTITCLDLFTHAARSMYFDHNVRVSGLAAQVIKRPGRSDAVLPDLPRAHFDMIYVDGGHLAATVFLDAALAWPLLKPGGLMIFDDYRWQPELPAFARPQMAIDLFLEVWAAHLELLHREYQVVVRKRGDGPMAEGARPPRGGPGRPEV